MTAAYLWLNAVLYVVFAVMCSLRVASTSRAIGYTQLSASGVSEYLTVYGGLQAGLAIFFAFTACRPELHRTGLLFALALYAPIVLFRWISVARQWPVERMTLGVGTLEAVLLIVAVALWFHRR